MSPISLDADAFLMMKELSAWLYETTEMEEEKRNLFRCVDEHRHAKVGPLLEKLGLDKIKGHGYKIWRITGKITIKKTPHYQSLFFPLSVGSGHDSIASGEVQVAGEVLTPGNFIPITSPLTVDARLDCLIVLLPDPSNALAAEK